MNPISSYREGILAKAKRVTPIGVWTFLFVWIALALIYSTYYNITKKNEFRSITNKFVSCWKKGDLSGMKKFCHIPRNNAEDIQKFFFEVPSSSKYIVPEKTRSARMENPIILKPLDWKGRKTPWVIDLTRGWKIKSLERNLIKKTDYAYTLTLVRLNTNQGPLFRKLVLIWRTDNEKIYAAYLYPPYEKTEYD